MPVTYSPPALSRNAVENLVRSIIDAKFKQYETILDGVSLEELTNFDVPLLSAQTPEEKADGILLSYKDGKLVEENNLNGGEF